jgi:predicted DNA-binding protein YlxM (UPF0122 family)
LRKVAIVLNKKQKKCAELMCLGTLSQVEIARELKITEQTICNWKKDDEFLQEISKSAQQKIIRLVPKAINKLNALLDSKNESIQLNAIKDVLDRAGHKAQSDVKINANITSEKLADVFKQIGGEGLEE